MNIFLSCDPGSLLLHNRTIDFVGDALAAVLVTTSHTPDRANNAQYSHISTNLASGVSAVALTSKTITSTGTKVRFDCDTISFGSNVSTAGRYIFILKGNHAALNSTDPILGYISLSESGNVTSTNSVFSWTPPTEGLFEIARSAAPV
jgi:hypothetical protein